VSHRLNLIASQAVGSCSNAVDLFGNLEKMFTFITGSKARSAFFLSRKTDRTLSKTTNKISEACKHYSLDVTCICLNTVLDVYEAVYQTIEEVRNRDGGSDFKLGADCNGLLSYLTSYRFLMTALSFKKIFEILEKICSYLSTNSIDIF